jgi:hypothetical protein
MADRQDWYIGQIVTEGDMDTIYDDLENAERNLAKESHLGQDIASNAHRAGGILSNLVVTKKVGTTTTVEITDGAARDGNGKRIAFDSDAVGFATVSLVNLGDTPEGDITDATGNGSLTASSITSGEAWLSLFIAFDTHLSDTRVDALNNTIHFRQTESFHFELMIGTDSAAPATSRANLADTRILLCDILLDNNGEIRIISTLDAICNSSFDFNAIGYGPEDAAALYGRRGDWLAIDPDGTDFTLLQTAYDSSQPHNHAYYNIRAGSPREGTEKLINLYATPGTSSKAGGSEIIGVRPITGKALSAPASAAALQMPSGSVHTQLEALYDKVNTLLSRGNDTLTGNLTVTGTLAVSTNITVTGTATFDSDVTIKGTAKIGSASPETHQLEGGGSHRAMFGIDGTHPIGIHQIEGGGFRRMLIGIDSTHTTGRARFSEEGRFTAEGGIVNEPEDETIVASEENASNLVLPENDLVITKTLLDDTVIKKNAWGQLRRGRHTVCNMNDIRNVDWLSTPPEGYATAGTGLIYQSAIGGLVTLMSGSTTGDAVGIARSGNFILDTAKSIGVYFHMRFSLSAITDYVLAIGLSNMTLPAFVNPSTDNFAGIIKGTSDTKFQAYTCNAGAAHNDDTGVTIASSTIYDFYMYYKKSGSGDVMKYWLTGMGAAMVQDTSAVFSDGPFWSLYAVINPNNNASKILRIHHAEVFDTDYTAW